MSYYFVSFQDLYPCFPRIVSVFENLLQLQDAPLISHIFKALGHIFKTTWKQMLADLPSVMNILTPLLRPPTKHYVSRFAAESVAFLIRKHPSPLQVIELLESKVKEGGDAMIKPVATLLFETIKGVQYKFNTFAKPYLTVMLSRAPSSEIIQCVHTELFKHVVIKITKTEVAPLWEGILNSLNASIENMQNMVCQNEESIDTEVKLEGVDFILVLLSWVDILLEGGRHTYLMSSSDVWKVISPMCSKFQYSHSLETKFSETLHLLINAHNHLMRYLQNTQSRLDVQMLTFYVEHHYSLDTLTNFIEKLSDLPEFFKSYSPVLFDKLQLFDTLTYSQVLADLVICCESQNILEIPLLTVKNDFKETLVKTIADTKDPAIVFNLLKILQCCGVLSESSQAGITEFFDRKDRSEEMSIYFETVKCMISGGIITSSTPSAAKNKCLTDVNSSLTDNFNNPVVLKTIYLLLKHCSPEDISLVDASSIFILLKVGN